MMTLTEIQSAIDHSIHYNEPALLIVDDPKLAVDTIKSDSNISNVEYNHAEIGIGDIIDIAGERKGEDFRIFVKI